MCFLVASQPNSAFEPNDPILKRVPLVIEPLDSQFSQQFPGFVIFLVSFYDSFHPSGSNNRNCVRIDLLWSTGQSIRRSIGGALLVDDFVLQAHETKECLLMDERVEFVIT
jgi:hypothetical protein